MGEGAAKRSQHPLAIMWIYSGLRIGLFLALWGVVYLLGLSGLVGAFVALVLSVPLSYALFGKQRRALAASLHDRMTVRQERTDELDSQLAGEPPAAEADAVREDTDSAG